MHCLRHAHACLIDLSIHPSLLGCVTLMCNHEMRVLQLKTITLIGSIHTAITAMTATVPLSLTLVLILALVSASASASARPCLGFVSPIQTFVWARAQIWRLIFAKFLHNPLWLLLRWLLSSPTTSRTCVWSQRLQTASIALTHLAKRPLHESLPTC